LNIAIFCKTAIHIDHMVEGLRQWPVTVCRSREELLEAIPDKDVVVALNQGFHFHSIDEEVLSVAKRLKFIQHYGVSYDATDAVAAKNLGIQVATLPGQNSRSVAEQALFLLLALSRRLHVGERLIREGRIGDASCVELEGKTLCLVGLGIIGKMMVKMAHGLSMDVIGVRKDPTNSDVEGLGINKVFGTDQLHEALGMADFTILLVPLTEETHDIIDAGAFKAMKRTGMLINMSRGPNVSLIALEEALKNDEISGFGSDVYWTEPADPNDALFHDERVVISPHLGGSSIECIERTIDQLKANLLRFEKNEPLHNVVN
jgi:phosphoglycerate dehydrogenase-like enzyme